MNHQIKAILFDLDGVVVFTDKYHYLGWKKLADEKGWDFDEEVNHACRGISRVASLQVILGHNKIDLSEDEKEKLANVKNEYYKELIKQINLDDIYPGIMEFLKKLKAEGVRLAICSSSKNAMTVLDALDLSKYFDAVVSGNDIKNPKPDPEIFLNGAKLLNMHPVHCLVFEDAESGVEAAHAAKMKCIGVGNPERLPNAFDHVTDYNDIDIRALLDAGRVKSISEEAWRVTETELKNNRFPFWETAFALSNGVMGVRGTFEESSVGYKEYPATFLNGICGYESYHHLWKLPGYPDARHAILNICDWTNIDLIVDGENLSVATSILREHKRSLDLKRGILEREFVWETNSGKKVHVKTERIVSMVRRNIAALRYSVTPETDCELIFKSKTHAQIVSRVMAGEQVEIEKLTEEDGVDIIWQNIKTADDKVVLAQSYSFEGQKNIEGDILNYRFSTKAHAGKTVSLDKIFAAFFIMDEPSPPCRIPAAGGKEDLGGCYARILKEISSARDAGFEKLREEQENFWAQFWKDADIKIEGNVQDQQAVRFSLFHLRQSNPEKANRSISANGLTGDEYSGLVFWDTEMYMLPPLIYI